MATRIDGIEVSVGADTAAFSKALADVNGKLNTLEGNLKKPQAAAGGLGGALDGVGKSLLAFASVGFALEIGEQILDVTGQFQKLNAVLGNTLGGTNQGEVAFAKIQDLAVKTNFSVLELTDTFVDLANSGFVPTTRELENLADLANSTGKTFDQLGAAIIDAQTGEFERLKEFGIKASKSGDQVSLTFKGVKTTIDNSTESLRGYILGLGDLEGVQGSTAAISKTLQGLISNLGDSFDNLFNVIGSKGAGAFSAVVDGLSRIINATAKAIAGTDEYAKKQNLLAQAKISEELPAQLADLEKQYINIGFSAQDAAKKAREFYSGTASNEVAQYEKQLESVERRIDQIKEKSRAPVPGALFESGYETEGRVFSNEGDKAQIEALRVRQDAIRSLINVQQQYLTTIQDVDDKNTDSANKVKDQIKPLTDVEKAINGINKALKDANSNEVVFGDDFDIASERVKILEGGIKKLIDVGLTPASAAVQKLVKELDSAKEFEFFGSIKAITDFFGRDFKPKIKPFEIDPIKIKAEIDVDTAFASILSGQLGIGIEQAKYFQDTFKGLSLSLNTSLADIGDAFQASGESPAAFKESLENLIEVGGRFGIAAEDIYQAFLNSGLGIDEFVAKTAALEGAAQQFNSLFESLAISAANGIGEAVGSLVSGTESAQSAVKKFIGGIASQLGSGLIAIGTPLVAVGVTAAQGLAYIAGGIALKALASTLGASGGGSGGGGGRGAAPRDAFEGVNSGLSTGSVTQGAPAQAQTPASSLPNLGSQELNVTLDGTLTLSDRGGALIGYIESQQRKLTRTSG